MSTKSAGDVPPEVHRLAETLSKKFEKSLDEPSAKLDAEIEDLRTKIGAHGFMVAIVAIQDVRGDVEKLQLAVYRVHAPKLH